MKAAISHPRQLFTNSASLVPFVALVVKKNSATTKDTKLHKEISIDVPFEPSRYACSIQYPIPTRMWCSHLSGKLAAMVSPSAP